MIFSEDKLHLLVKEIEEEKEQGKKIVWTNGCFDILHPGHLQTFKKAKELGDILIVGINGEKSPYWKTKPGRPINDEYFRSVMLDALKYVDYIYIYNEDTPIFPVEEIKPDIVLKGGDYIQESIKKMIEQEDGYYNLTAAYRFIQESNDEKFYIEKGFMPEGLVNVKNGGEVYIVSTLGKYSTTSIIDKIKS